MRGFGAKFFGDGFLAEPSKVAQKLVEGAFKDGAGLNAARDVAIGGLAGAQLHSLTGATLVSVGAGFVVALVFRAVESAGKLRAKARKSRLRYLTALQNEGVTFAFS